MDRRNDESRPRRWIAALAAGCLILQAAVSGLALWACASPSLAEEPAAIAQTFGQSDEGPDGHHHQGAPDCCFFACHLLTGKTVSSSAEIVLGPTETATAGLDAPDRSRRGNRGHEHLPQNPRAPPLSV